MCEANAYLHSEGEEELILEAVDLMEPDEKGGFLLVSIFGEQKTVNAKLKGLRLVEHKIIFEKQK